MVTLDGVADMSKLLSLSSKSVEEDEEEGERLDDGGSTMAKTEVICLCFIDCISSVLLVLSS